jgi:PAS domain S-box-containing protein
MKIRTRIIGAVMLVVLAVGLVNIAYFFWRDRQTALQDLHASMEQNDRLLGLVLAGPLYDGNLEQLNRNLDSFFLDPDMVQIRLKERVGTIDLVRQRPKYASQGELLVRIVPIARGPDTLGEVRTTYTTALIEERLAHSRDELILFWSTLLLVLTAVIILVARGLTGPVDRLTQAARAIADGNLDQEIGDMGGAEELVVLERSFARMRAAIKEQIHALADNNRKLQREMAERNTAQEALRLSDERLRQAVRVSNIGIFDHDHRTDAIYWSPEQRAIYGWDPVEAVDLQGFLRHVFPGDLERIGAAVARAHDPAGDGRFDVEHRVVRRDGEVRWLATRSQTVFAGEGAARRPVRTIGAVLDFTERKRQEEALRESEARISEAYATLNDAIESAPAAIAIYDAEDRLFAFNSGYRAFFAFDQTIVRLGADFRTLIRSFTESGQIARPQRATDSWLEERWRQHRNPAGPIEVELTDGRWLQITETRTQTGGIITVYNDITALKEREEQLRRLNAELEERVAQRTAALAHANEELAVANKDLESFSYSVSHDLRAPLRAMAGYSSILLDESRDSLHPNAARHLQRIHAGALRMAALIDDLLRLSQVGRAEMHRQDVNLSELANQVLGALADASPERRVEAVVSPRMRANGDPGLIRHLLENLLSNAWKFTGRTNAPRIELGCEPRGREKVYFVRDNGAGFDMQYANRLFTAFQRLHRSEEFEGTGIGLSIVQRVVTRHGGRIWVESKPGQGTTFWFTLEAAGVQTLSEPLL